MAQSLDDIVALLKEGEAVQFDDLATHVLASMMVAMPLFVLYRDWEERKGSVPFYVNKVYTNSRAHTTGKHARLNYYHMLRAVGDSVSAAPSEDDVMRAFNEAVVTMQQRIRGQVYSLLMDGHPCMRQAKADLLRSGTYSTVVEREDMGVGAEQRLRQAAMRPLGEYSFVMGHK